MDKTFKGLLRIYVMLLVLANIDYDPNTTICSMACSFVDKSGSEIDVE
jgi:hypothetical protein